MAPAIVLYYSPGSCSLAVHIVLNEIGQPFALKKFATAERANYSAEYLALNPKGRIPTLQIDGFVLTENPAILGYLGRRFPDAGLYPVGPSEAEARCLELLAWSSNTVHVAYAQLFRPERFVPHEQNYPPVKESGRLHYERCLADIDQRLQRQEYAIGAKYSVVDPFWLVFYRWGVRSNFDMRSRFPAYTAFAERLCNRPSVQRTLAAEQISVWN
jgi:glutathione S-transferase